MTDKELQEKVKRLEAEKKRLALENRKHKVEKALERERAKEAKAKEEARLADMRAKYGWYDDKVASAFGAILFFLVFAIYACTAEVTLLGGLACFFGVGVGYVIIEQVTIACVTKKERRRYGD